MRKDNAGMWSVPMKASPDFTNRFGDPLPPGAYAKKLAKTPKIKKVKPTKKTVPMPKVKYGRKPKKKTART